MLVMFGLMSVGSLFGTAALTRLRVIGYSANLARRAAVGLVLVAAVVIAVILRAAPDGIIGLSFGQEFLAGGVFLAANALFLVAARIFSAARPPRGTSIPAAQVKPAMPRGTVRPWSIPVMVAGLGIFFFHLAQAGQWVVMAIFGAAIVAGGVELVLVETNYRRQQALADTGGGRVAVILLRSFVSDRVSGGEFTIAKAVRNKFGRFVALGDPSDERLPFGAERQYLLHESWQVELTQLARGARVILMLPAVTPSIRWELEMIRREQLDSRFYVVQPRAHPITFMTTFYRMLAGIPNPFNWTDFAQVLREVGFQGVPEATPDIGFVIGFDGEGRCVELARGLKKSAQLVQRIAAQATLTTDLPVTGETSRAITNQPWSTDPDPIP